MKKPVKVILISLISLIIALSLITGIAFTVLAIKTDRIDDDYSFVYSSEKYSSAVKAENVEVITQNVSCGYAVIQMFSAWNGGNITEESLYAEYGKVVTSTGKSFCKEFNKQFPQYETKMYKYLKNSELIDKAC